MARPRSATTRTKGILPRRHAQLPRAPRLVARRRPRGHDAGGDDRAVFARRDCRRRRRSSIPKKLEWMNGQHLSRISALELEPRLTPALIDAGVATSRDVAIAPRLVSWIDRSAEGARANGTDDMVRQAAPFFPGAIVYDPEAVEKQWKDRDGHRRYTRATCRAARDVSTRGRPKRWRRRLRTLAERARRGGRQDLSAASRCAHRTHR